MVEADWHDWQRQGVRSGSNLGVGVLFALSRKYVDTLSRKHVDSLQNLSLGLGAPENVNRLKRVNFVVRKPRE